MEVIMKLTQIKANWEVFIALFKQLFTRSKESVFWLVLFPSILFMILTTIFGKVEENIDLSVKILGESRTLSKVFENLPQLSAEFVKIEDIQKQRSVLENELKAGKIQAFVILPNDFDSKFAFASLLQKTRLKRKIEVEIYFVPIRQESKVAQEILNGIFNSLGSTVQAKYEIHDLSKGHFSYNEFIYPGVIGMAILSAFLFGFMNDIVYMYKRGILRRLYTTPLSLITVYFSLGIVTMIQLILGIFILSIFAWFKGVNIHTYVPSLLVNIPISCAILVLMSIVIVSFSKSTSRIFVFEQVFFQVQMFVGGFYFPLKFANPFVKSIARILPLTYTVDALRIPSNLNVLDSGHMLVPVMYILVLLVVSAVSVKRLRNVE